MIDKSVVVCPHLGMQHDETTSFAYPSGGNYCYNCRIPSSPAEEHQAQFCLTRAHTECPVFAMDKHLPFPKNVIPVEGTRKSSGLRGRILWCMLGLIVVIIASYFISIYIHTGKVEFPMIFRGSSSQSIGLYNIIPVTGVSPTYAQGAVGELPFPATATFALTQLTDASFYFSPTVTASKTLEATYTKTPLPSKTKLATLTSQTITKTASLSKSSSLSPSKTKSEIPSKTHTTTPTSTKTPKPSLTSTEQVHGLETPFTVNSHQFIVHMVTSGENYEILARNYNTTVEIILAINYQAPSPLWVKSTIVIAPGLLHDDPAIPALQTYQVIEKTTDIETLAAKYNADPATMKLFNQCDDNCSLIMGDWVLIPHPR